MGTKARLIIAAVVAAVLGVAVASTATGQVPGYTSSTQSSTGSSTTSTTTNSNRKVSIHFGLRFKRTGKHIPIAVIAKAKCHSSTCNLSGSGQLKIKGAGKFNLGKASANVGRGKTGNLVFKIPDKASKAIKKFLRSGGRKSQIRA